MKPIVNVNENSRPINPPPYFPDDLPGATELERQFWRILKQHLGYENAILATDVAAMLGVADTRIVRDLRVSLILNHGRLIGSSCKGRAGGYFLVVDEEDLQITLREQLARMRTTRRIVQTLDKTLHDRLFNAEQFELFDPLPSDAPESANHEQIQKNLLDALPPLDNRSCQRCAELRRVGSKMKCQMHTA